MSYVIAAPELLATAAADVAGIGSSLSAARSTPSTTGLIAAAEDEVSAAITALFFGHGQALEALSAPAAPQAPQASASPRTATCTSQGAIRVVDHSGRRGERSTALSYDFDSLASDCVTVTTTSCSKRLLTEPLTLERGVWTIPGEYVRYGANHHLLENPNGHQH
jgi:hypothetical protein